MGKNGECLIFNFKNMNRFELGELNQEEIDMLAEEELSDRVGVKDKEFEEEQVRLLEEFISQTNSELNTLSKVIEMGKPKDFIFFKTGIDINKLNIFLNQKVEIILKNLELLKENKNVVLISFNSFVELKNVFMGLTTLLNNFNKNKTKNKEVSDVVIRGFKKYFDYGLVYYVEELSIDEKKLKEEISRTEGFLEKYDNYFVSFPAGTKKLPYFRFFSELEKGNITNENLYQNLKIIDTDDLNFLNINKVIKDFNDGILIENYANTNTNN